MTPPAAASPAASAAEPPASTPTLVVSPATRSTRPRVRNVQAPERRPKAARRPSQPRPDTASGKGSDERIPPADLPTLYVGAARHESTPVALVPNWFEWVGEDLPASELVALSGRVWRTRPITLLSGEMEVMELDFHGRGLEVQWVNRDMGGFHAVVKPTRRPR